MSDEHESLGDETVHGVKNVWQRFGNWDDEPKDEVKPEPEPVPEPEPQPEPKPEPQPEPEPEPEQPAMEVDETLVRKMSLFLRKRDGMDRREAADKIRNCPKLYCELKNLKRW